MLSALNTLFLSSLWVKLEYRSRATTLYPKALFYLSGRPRTSVKWDWSSRNSIQHHTIACNIGSLRLSRYLATSHIRPGACWYCRRGHTLGQNFCSGLHHDSDSSVLSSSLHPGWPKGMPFQSTACNQIRDHYSSIPCLSPAQSKHPRGYQELRTHMSILLYSWPTGFRIWVTISSHLFQTTTRRVIRRRRLFLWVFCSDRTSRINLRSIWTLTMVLSDDIYSLDWYTISVRWTLRCL